MLQSAADSHLKTLSHALKLLTINNENFETSIAKKDDKQDQSAYSQLLIKYKEIESILSHVNNKGKTISNELENISDEQFTTFLNEIDDQIEPSLDEETEKTYAKIPQSTQDFIAEPVS